MHFPRFNSILKNYYFLSDNTGVQLCKKIHLETLSRDFGMEAFGIFEGGGAKGLAHIGALKAAEEHGVEFIGLAGTSAGAIVAALIACGYKADELYDENKTGLFSTDFLAFFEQKDWQNLQAIKSDFDKTFNGSTDACTLFNFLRRNRKKLERFYSQGGLLDTKKFESWFNICLLKKLRLADETFEPSGDDNTVTFQDLPRPLKVIAADVVGRCLRVFTMPGDARQNVAEAVGASISIPFIFLPKETSTARFVDGGIVSNFPAWVFDDERTKAPALTPTLGFRLVETRQIPNQAVSEKFSLFSYLSDVFQTAVFGDNTLERRQVATLHEIPLRVRVGPLDFQVSEQVKYDVYRDGKNDTRDYLRMGHIWRISDSYMKRILVLAEGIIRNALNHQGHLRLNIMLPISNNTLQIVYTCNMDNEEDCDDRLEFKKGSGACGHCWEILDYVVCDLVDATNTYKDRWSMDKYQQRLIRKELRSLLCVPLFDQKKVRELESGQVSLRKAFIGVLNIDSVEDLLERFTELVNNEDDIAKDCAAMISERLMNPGV